MKTSYLKRCQAVLGLLHAQGGHAHQLVIAAQACMAAHHKSHFRCTGLQQAY